MYGDNGDMAIASYGIANRVIFIFIMVVLGVTQGMQPIVGYNYGARHHDRVRKALMLTILWGTVVTTLGFMISVFMPETVAKAFTTEKGLIEMAAWAMRVMSIFMPIIGFQLVTTNFFQSIGKVNKSIFLSLTRQVLMLIPLLIILPHFFGEKGVWYSMPISDIVAAMLTVVMLILQFREWNRENKNKSAL
jgi:Na+-driven multidrug efflux pump